MKLKLFKINQSNKQFKSIKLVKINQSFKTIKINLNQLN